MTEIEEAESLVNKSGNTFHCKVTNYFKKNGWETLVSPYYMDNSTNKAREIDLIVEKSYPQKTIFGDQKGYINIKLFIECKYIPYTNVFWFDKKDFLSATQWLTYNTPLRENNTFIEQHHYISTNHSVAKLFASKNNPNTENEVIYKALNQSLNAMVYLRNKGTIIPNPPQGHRCEILATIELPVILCNNFNKFFSVQMSEPSDPKLIKENFQLEVNYAYINNSASHRSEYFLIDVIDFEKMDVFLNVIDKDIEAINAIVQHT